MCDINGTPMTGTQYNRTAAFVEFCKGTPLEQIAHALVIPILRLKQWRRDEQWDSLMGMSITQTTAVAAPQSVEAQERIQANREKNLLVAQKLQEDLLEVIGKLRAGTLKIEKVFANGSSVSLDPSLRDRCDLALYAKNVAEISYRALGDVESAKNAHVEGGNGIAGQITIVMPAMLSAPREKMADEAVDIESSVVEEAGIVEAPAC